MSEPTMLEILNSRDLIVDVFKSMRKDLLASYGNTDFAKKTDGTPVTTLDVEVEMRVKERLLAEFPKFGFCGEETPQVMNTYDATWYIDPIDSTASFLRGIPYCTNMAGLVVSGEIVASIIYHFVTDDLYTAIKGEGAFVNDERLKINNLPLSDSFVYADAYSYVNIHDLYVANGVKFYAPVGATGHFMTSVASSKIQGVCYYAAKLNPHDVIPGILLIKEAGGDVVSFSGKEFDYNCVQFMAGTSHICEVANRYKNEISNGHVQASKA